MELEKPTGPAVQHGGSSGSGGQVDAGPRSVVTPVVANAEPGAANRTLEKPCTTPSKRAKRIMGLEICVLEASDDVFDSGWPQPNPRENPGETGSDEARQKADEQLPKRDVYGMKPSDLLHSRLAVEGRARELSTLCGQNALFVIPRSQLVASS